MPFRFLHCLLATLLAFALAGCIDGTLPTSYSAPPRAASGASTPFGGESAPAWEGQCHIRVADEGARTWRRGRIPLRFPEADRSARGTSRRYTFVRFSDAGTLSAVAECTIPATEGALSRMNRRFNAKAFRLLDPADPEQGMVVATDCASCLEPIVVVACPAGYERDEVTGNCVSAKPGDEETGDPGDGDGCAFGCGGEEWGGGGGSQPYYGPYGQAPVGVDQAWFNALNLAELTLCLAAPFDCALVYAASAEAHSWASRTAIALGYDKGVRQDGTWWNALLHARWNSNMAYGILGAIQAEIWANAHEWNSDATHPYTAMDLHNNAVGRRVSPGALTGALGEMSVILDY